MAHTPPLKRLLPLAATTAVLCVCAVASAAALNGVDANDLAVGASTVLACDPDGVTLTQVTAGSTVTDLSIAGIDAACVGGELHVTLSDAGGTAVATAGPITIAGATEVIAVSPTVDTTAFVNHHLRIVGP